MNKVYLLLAILVVSCGPLGPGPGVPECPTGTTPTVCRTIGYATCHPSDSLDEVTGCAVTTDTGARLKCVSGC